MVCDVDFNPVNSDVIVTLGKEHLAWWSVLPEQGVIQMQFKADYGVCRTYIQIFPSAIEANNSLRIYICSKHIVCSGFNTLEYMLH